MENPNKKIKILKNCFVKKKCIFCSKSTFLPFAVTSFFAASKHDGNVNKNGNEKIK